MFNFQLLQSLGRARAGTINTPHGEIRTPVFAPVGTQATIKALTPKQLEELGIQLILANTYHLFLRPGDELIKNMGGLHKFMGWNKPILTDSGGFQLFSLTNSRQIDDDGVTFKSHIDGSIFRLTPEKSIKIQENLGADIIMAFDECASPYDREYIEKSTERTHIWADRCLAAHKREDQLLFGIVQGGIFPDLRQKSAEYLISLQFPGFAIGGLSVGETREEMYQIINGLDYLLPQDKPRYLMGVGSPIDILQGVLRGIDIFDCVLPTRLARHHTAMNRTERLNLLNAKYAHDHDPIDLGCSCYTCANFSRAYLRHLIQAKEILAATLISIHNLYTLNKLCNDLHYAIMNQSIESIIAEVLT